MKLHNKAHQFAPVGAEGASACAAIKVATFPVGRKTPAKPGWTWETVPACVALASRGGQQRAGNYQPAVEAN